MLFSFGQSERERVEVDVLRYERAVTGDYDDDNWLSVKISVRAGEFQGRADASIITYEIEVFISEVKKLLEIEQGSATFQTMEGQLSLVLTADGKGHIQLKGEVEDKPGIGNRLSFALEIDQSQLAQSLREMESVALKFPVRSTNLKN